MMFDIGTKLISPSSDFFFFAWCFKVHGYLDV